MPTEMDELRRRIMQLEIEREALKLENDKDQDARKRLDVIEEELASLEAVSDIELRSLSDWAREMSTPPPP